MSHPFLHGLAESPLEEWYPRHAHWPLNAFIAFLFLTGAGVATFFGAVSRLYAGGTQHFVVEMPGVRSTKSASPAAASAAVRSLTVWPAHTATLQVGGKLLPSRGSSSAGSSMRGVRAFAEPKRAFADEEETPRQAAPWAESGEKDLFSALKTLNFNSLGTELSKAVDYYAMGGRRKKRWTKDFRPESQRGIAAGPSATSKLSWGGAKSTQEYQEMAEQFEDESSKRAAIRLENQPLGSAASALYGEAVKASAELDDEVYDRCLVADVPMAGDEACNIDGPVELAELIRGKYGRYYDVDVKKSRDALNEGVIILFVYSAFLGRKDFPYTEEQWLKKLNNIVILLSDLNQAWYVKKYLLSQAVGSTTILGPRMSRPTNDKALTFRISESPTWENPRDTDIFDSWQMLQGTYDDFAG